MEVSSISGGEYRRDRISTSRPDRFIRCTFPLQTQKSPTSRSCCMEPISTSIVKATLSPYSMLARRSPSIVLLVEIMIPRSECDRCVASAFHPKRTLRLTLPALLRFKSPGSYDLASALAAIGVQQSSALNFRLPRSPPCNGRLEADTDSGWGLCSNWAVRSCNQAVTFP